MPPAPSASMSVPPAAPADRPSRRTFVKTIASLPLLGAIGPFNVHVRAADQRTPFASDNPAILRARAAALSILKPSARDLDHGYRLHAESLVFESYGFAPRAALDGAKFKAVADAGASDRELVDLREEMSMTRWATDAAEREEFLHAMRAAGVTCIFQNTGEEGSDPLRLMKRLARFTFATDLAPDVCAKAGKPDDIVAAKKANRHCLYFTTNGVPLHQQWDNVRDELQHIRIFQELGVRMMHLTYNRRNPIGDGAGEPNDGGLSDFGHTVVKEMNRLGVICDVSHSGWRTSLEAAKASRRPMVASHTTCGGVYQHFRGKPDETVRAICDTGGLIGICCISRFIGGAGDIAAFLDHIDYAVKKFGADHVAIGPDISHTSRHEPAERAKVTARANGRSPLAATGPRWEHLWPVDTYTATPHAVQSIAWTNWPLFTVGLVQRGHSDETIRKILGENALRVTRANWGEKAV
ncbi:dipeptidase [Horticoccus sp. 23ND18S-11]|uniref:dipeptidase n=1 Tax=Horticoccus sp. 23ND18S-11 TaxID=3391832 RepID=UPI0039C8F1B4